MKILIKNIIFDFDGVILNSIPVKTDAYKTLFKTFDSRLVEKMVVYHEQNGGISRYEKIKYFFNTLLGEEMLEEEIHHYANEYSKLTKRELAQSKYLIHETVGFIQRNSKDFNMHIASGADELDLKFICDNLDLTQYFKSIHGSPQKKVNIVSEILYENGYSQNETILIGDSINDYRAAKENGIVFYGYNNMGLKGKSYYLDDFKSLE
jgi:HAD superfamily hydrolase (TIGR01549 family)